VGTGTGPGPPSGTDPDPAPLEGTIGPTHGPHDDTDMTEKRSRLSLDPLRNLRKRLKRVRRYGRPMNSGQNLASNHLELRTHLHDLHTGSPDHLILFTYTVTTCYVSVITLQELLISVVVFCLLNLNH